jgi:hypothetical protein
MDLHFQCKAPCWRSSRCPVQRLRWGSGCPLLRSVSVPHHLHGQRARARCPLPCAHTAALGLAAGRAYAAEFLLRKLEQLCGKGPQLRRQAPASFGKSHDLAVRNTQAV